MLATHPRKPRLGLLRRIRPFNGQAETATTDHHVDYAAGLLAIPVDVARVYRQLPLSAPEMGASR